MKRLHPPSSDCASSSAGIVTIQGRLGDKPAGVGYLGPVVRKYTENLASSQEDLQSSQNEIGVSQFMQARADSNAVMLESADVNSSANISQTNLALGKKPPIEPNNVIKKHRRIILQQRRHTHSQQDLDGGTFATKSGNYRITNYASQFDQKPKDH